MSQRIEKTIQHPDELWADLRERSTSIAINNRDPYQYREGLLKGLEIAMSLVEAHTSQRWVEA